MMYYFTREQKVVRVGGHCIGGQPGENPTALFGTVFYGRSFKSMGDEEVGLGKELIGSQEDLADTMGLTALADVYIKSADNVERCVDAVLDATDRPFSIDSSEPETRAMALRYLSKQKALDRVVYNSVNLGITKEEFEALKKYSPAAAIVLAYNPRDMSVDGRAELLGSGAGMLALKDVGLLDIAGEAGIEGVLIDTGATPFGSMSAEALRSMPVFKNLHGLPVGCSIHNTVESWGWMRDHRRSSEKSYDMVNAAANALIPLAGGDFTVYGPIDKACDLFASMAFADKLVAEGAIDYFNQGISERHPHNILK
jgi:tetrahydromethanopterin S-methyltransferase subunit H